MNHPTDQISEYQCYSKISECQFSTWHLNWQGLNGSDVVNSSATPSYTKKCFTVVFHRGLVCVWAPQVSTFSFCFLLFFRNDGGLNFFFFLDGDLQGEPSGVPPCGLAGGAAGVEEVSLVERAFIPFSSSSVVCFSSSPPFCMAGESVFASSAPPGLSKNKHRKLSDQQREAQVGWSCEAKCYTCRCRWTCSL